MNRTFLKGLGLEQEVIDSIMSEYGKDVESLKGQITNLTNERDDAKEALKSFDGVDIDELKKENTNIKNEYEEKIKNIKINGAIEKALTCAKAKHADLLLDKFDREKIIVDDKGNVQGIDEQLNEFKEEYSDLFSSMLEGRNPNNPEIGNNDGFNFNFTGVRNNK